MQNFEQEHPGREIPMCRKPTHRNAYKAFVKRCASGLDITMHRMHLACTFDSAASTDHLLELAGDRQKECWVACTQLMLGHGAMGFEAAALLQPA